MRALTLSSLGVVIGLSLVGCSDGGGGDTIAPVEGNVLGTGRSIASVNRLTNEDGSVNLRPGVNDIVSVTGARVTWVDQYDETNQGNSSGNIFLQDFTAVAGPYEGVLAFQSSYSPPSFRTSVGDVVDIAGQYTEFQLADANKGATAGWTTPEFVGGNIALRFDAPYIPIVPAEISPADLVSYDTGRQWLAMVVTASEVKLVSDIKPPSGGRFSMTINAVPGISTNPTITNELFDLYTYAEQVRQQLGKKSLGELRVKRVTGLVTLAFQFHIAPRTADDIEFE